MEGSTSGMACRWRYASPLNTSRLRGCALAGDATGPRDCARARRQARRGAPAAAEAYQLSPLNLTSAPRRHPRT